jgi:hypothetical protein
MIEDVKFRVIDRVNRAAKKTIAKPLRDIDEAASKFQDGILGSINSLGQ